MRLRLELGFPQENQRLRVTARTWRCKGEAPRPFELCLTLTHDGFDEVNQSYANATGGWPIILARMKDRLEAGAGAQ